MRYDDMTSALTPCNSTTVILLIDFCVTMHLNASLPHQILDYYIRFAIDLAINIKNWCYIDEDITVGTLYLAIVVTRQTTQAYCVNFLECSPSRKK